MVSLTNNEITFILHHVIHEQKECDSLVKYYQGEEDFDSRDYYKKKHNMLKTLRNKMENYYG